MQPIEKDSIKKRLEKELKRLQHEIVTDVFSTFNRRLDRYLRIKSIKFLLNNFFAR